MGRNRTRRNCSSSSAHSSKWRERIIKIAVTVLILGIVIALCCTMWKSEAYANAVSDVFLAILSTGLVTDIILFILGEREKKKGDESEERKNRYVYYVVVIAIAIVILIICLIIAKGHWGEHEDRSQSENKGFEVMGENTEVNESILLKQATSTKDINEFSWPNNLYIINGDDYVTVPDKTDKLEILIINYIENYPEIDGNIIQKADEELNQGDYGKYIAEAKNYAHDVEVCTMTDVKVYALDREIEQREDACKEYKKYDNLKILGDCYLRKIELCELTDTEKQEILEKALKNYIETLACAYNDSNASGDYISVIWDEIIKIYEKLRRLGTLDDSHKAQALDMIKACEQCKQFF